jgi:conjugal transfer/entry exclusion protein
MGYLISANIRRYFLESYTVKLYKTTSVFKDAKVYTSTYKSTIANQRGTKNCVREFDFVIFA